MEDDVVGEEQETVPPVVEEAAPAENPEWNSIWEDVAKTDTMAPFQDKFREALKPHLSRFDQRYQEVSTKYAPWKGFEDSGVTPDVARRTLELAQQIESDPVGFHSRLSQYLKDQGLTPKEAEAAAASFEVSEDDVDLDPAVHDLKKRQDALEKDWQERQYNESKAKFEKEVEASLGSLRQKHAKSPIANVPFNEQEIIARVYSQIYAGGKPDFDKAYNDLAAIITSARSFPSNSQQTPSFTPSSGGNSLPLNTDSGIDGDKLNRMTKSERVKFVSQMMKDRSAT